MISRCLRFGLELIEQRVEALVVPFPQPAVAFQPPGRLAGPLGLEAARPPLRVTAARNQAGALQHLQVLGDRRKVLERAGTFRCLEIANGSASSVTDASPDARRARIARRVGSARAAKMVSRRCVACITYWLYTGERAYRQAPRLSGDP